MKTEQDRRAEYDEAMRERQREADKQALRDAVACRESRRVSRRANGCTCYCCTLERQTYGRD
jgi:hypothetical protein